MLSESQSASRKQEWAEANALAELSTEAVAKALAVVTETKLVATVSFFAPTQSFPLQKSLPNEKHFSLKIKKYICL